MLKPKAAVIAACGIRGGPSAWNLVSHRYPAARCEVASAVRFYASLDLDLDLDGGKSLQLKA